MNFSHTVLMEAIFLLWACPAEINAVQLIAVYANGTQYEDERKTLDYKRWFCDFSPKTKQSDWEDGDEGKEWEYVSKEQEYSGNAMTLESTHIHRDFVFVLYLEYVYIYDFIVNELTMCKVLLTP